MSENSQSMRQLPQYRRQVSRKYIETPAVLPRSRLMVGLPEAHHLLYRSRASAFREKGLSKIWTAAVSCWMALTICVLGGVIAPGLPISHRTLEIVLPGFTWISPAAFLLGLVESVFYGAYMALVFVWLHNFFVRRFGVARQTSTSAKVA